MVGSADGDDDGMAFIYFLSHPETTKCGYANASTTRPLVVISKVNSIILLLFHDTCGFGWILLHLTFTDSGHILQIFIFLWSLINRQKCGDEWKVNLRNVYCFASPFWLSYVFSLYFELWDTFWGWGKRDCDNKQNFDLSLPDNFFHFDPTCLSQPISLLFLFFTHKKSIKSGEVQVDFYHYVRLPPWRMLQCWLNDSSVLIDSQKSI